jgi:2-desacetyl-2-hydroxyethyl bacteriochlorophyllide A dehydrogenase
MRAAVLEEKERFAIREVPDPVLESDEVLIRVRYCGICGSDLHIFKEAAGVGPGHEFAGDIAAMGSDVRGWSVGDRVAVEPDISCGECHWCRQGEIGLCEQYYVRLLEYKGSFSTYVKAKASQLHRLPDDMSYEQAALVEPTTCALHAVRLGEMKEGDVVVVMGLGPIGQLAARVAKALGAGAVYAAEISPSRIDLARPVVDEVIDARTIDPVARVLELTQGTGPDIVIECAGSTTTTQQSLAMVRKGGTIVIAGICFDWVELPVSNIILWGLTVKGSICWAEGDYADAFDLVKNGRIDVAPLATCRVPIEDINEAFHMALRGEGGKIFVQP